MLFESLSQIVSSAHFFKFLVHVCPLIAGIPVVCCHQAGM